MESGRLAVERAEGRGESIRSTAPRICMPTWRNFAKNAYRCGLYEAQDVLAEVDDVDLINLDMTERGLSETRWLKTPSSKSVTSEMIFNVGLKKVKKTRLNKNYDVFVAVCSMYWDLIYINSIEDWRDRCKVSVCWIDEMWATRIPSKYWLGLLSRFDFVFMSCKGTVANLSQAMNRTCHWLPSGIDTLRFSPFPNPPDRVIDVYSIGRRSEGIHAELLRAAGCGEIFYVYDTFRAADSAVYNHRQHRDLFANTAKRSRYFMVAPAKMDANYQTQGQVEVGYRYYEGAAAGAVMIGQVPESETYRELFGWPEAVIPLQPDGSDIRAVLDNLNADPQRARAISRRNSTQALLQHDWIYRWNQVFRVAGIEPSARSLLREKRLRDMAYRITDAEHATLSR
jgi:hypothetical protein